MKTISPLIAFACINAVLSNPTHAANVDFPKEIQPILEKSCLSCHGAEKQKGKLRLDSRTAALKGGAEGAALVPGEAAKSELYRRVTLPKEDEDIMPNEGDPLSKAQQDLLRDWINQGAIWPEGVIGGKPEVAVKKRLEPVLPESFKPNAAEQAALKKLAQGGVDVRPVALSSPWREVNFRLLGAEITDASLAPLKDVKSLVDVNLATTKITDAGLVHLKGLAYLQKLNLSQTAVTDTGLKQLKGLTNLIYLNLYGTGVTDAGLESLKDMSFLSRVYTWQSKVTTNGMASLRKWVPGVDVIGGAEPILVTNRVGAAAAPGDEKK